MRSAWFDSRGACRGPDRRRSLRHCAVVSSVVSTPPRHLGRRRPIAVVRRRTGNTATRISSSNHPCFRRYLPIFRSLRPVGSAQVGLGRPSVECGLVGCSWRWWNDYQNDQQCKLGWVQEERTAPTSRVGVGWRRSCEVEQVAHGSSVAEPCHGAWSATLISDTSSGHR